MDTQTTTTKTSTTFTTPKSRFALSLDKAQEKRDEERRKMREERQAQKGNWPFSFQKNQNVEKSLQEEANYKRNMQGATTDIMGKIEHAINPKQSLIEQLVAKNTRGEKLKPGEKIQVTNHLKRQQELIAADYRSIRALGLVAKPETREGRMKLLLEVLKFKIHTQDDLSIANIYLKLQDEEFKLTPDLETSYQSELTKMRTIVQSLPMIQLQFTKFYSQMPPLNQNGFKSLDPWQIEVIQAINNNVSVVVNAPTSAGKSVLSAYTSSKGRVMYVVPTDALGWQMSAYIGNIIGSNVPILTSTYQTIPDRDKMIETLNNSKAIVGTPESILDFMPYIHINFNWIVFDEIHMIGKCEGNAMESIAKIIPDASVLALSATIANTDELVSWFKQISPSKQIIKVVCTKRFFNLQRFYYSPLTDSFECLHPLALIDEQHIADGSILNKTLQPTPPNTWDLAVKIGEKMDLGELDPNVYFANILRIELDQATEYFYKLIEFLVIAYKTNSDLKQKVNDIIGHYKHPGLQTSAIDLVKMTFKLKNEQKTPAIIFQKNTLGCLRMAREYAKNLEQLEANAYPTLWDERVKLGKLAERIEKKTKPSKQSESSTSGSKKELKSMIGLKIGNKSRDGETYAANHMNPVASTTIHAPSMYEPHPDFILGTSQTFTEGMINTWVTELNLKKYFPSTGMSYHFIIGLLWRGVGIYARGLPDPYLRLIQKLASNKQLSIVFSDQSLVFGISMPFRTVVVIRDEKLKDDLDPMLFHQMVGRAGRRGLDKEGNVIFAGYSWNRIKELSISESPVVVGSVQSIYTLSHANRLSEIMKTNQTWSNLTHNILDPSVTMEESIGFYQGVANNYQPGHPWSFGFIPDDPNHLHMGWKMRYSEENVIASFLLPFLKKGFDHLDPTKEINQINLAHFMLGFMSTTEGTQTHKLDFCQLLTKAPFDQIQPTLHKLGISIPEFIDPKLFLSIQLNKLYHFKSEDQTDELRQRLLDFSNGIKQIQHYCYYSKIVGLCRLFGKLLTRIWWIYHTSSPIMKPLYSYDTDEFVNVDELIDSDSDSDSETETETENEIET
jgi:superfamily II RNA helicase